MKLKSFNGSTAKAMPGIKDVFQIKVYEDDYVRGHFDTVTFPDIVAVVGTTTWEVMKAKEAVEVEWEPIAEHTIERNDYYAGKQKVTIPAGLESTTDHKAKMIEMANKSGEVIRKDGDPEKAFANAAKIVERSRCL